MILEEDIMEIAKFIKKVGIQNQKILITGATGLLGSLMAKGFLEANNKFDLQNKVYVLVRNEDKAYKVFDKYLNNNLVILKGDIREKITLSEDIDFVYHAAAVTTSSVMVSNPVDVIDISINGSKNIFDFALTHNAKSVVYLSSMEVCGQIRAEDKLDESKLGYVDLYSARSCYPESKRMVENLAYCYSQQFGLNIKVARLTQTFGAGVDYKDPKIFNSIARSVIENKDIELLTKGDSVRDYCYTTDAINAILLISTNGKKGECYNIANENTNMSIFDMSNYVAKNIAASRIKVVIKEGDNSKYMAPSIIKLDTAKLKSLGWEPKHDLKNMYERLIESHEESK